MSKRELDQKKIKYFFIFAFLIIGGLMVPILTLIIPEERKKLFGLLGIFLFFVIFCVPIVLILTAISAIFALILNAKTLIDYRILNLIPAVTFVICVILGQIGFLFVI